MASRIVQEIATVLSLEGSGKVVSDAREAFGAIEAGYDAQTAAAKRTETAVGNLTEAQKKEAAQAQAVAVQKARQAEEERKLAVSIAAARRAEATAEAERSRIAKATLDGKNLDEASSTAKKALLTNRADTSATVARARFDRVANGLDDAPRMAWAEMGKAFDASRKGGAAGPDAWRAAIGNAAPGALENEGLRKLVEQRLAFESGQQRIGTFGDQAVERTQREFADRQKKKVDLDKAREERKARLQESIARQEENRRVGGARAIMSNARTAAGIAGVETVPVSKAARDRLEKAAEKREQDKAKAAKKEVDDLFKATRDMMRAIGRVARMAAAEAKAVAREADKARKEADRAAAALKRDEDKAAREQAKKDKAERKEADAARDGFPKAVQDEIAANERLEKARARSTQAGKKGDPEGIAAAELAQKHAMHEAEEASKATRAAIDRVLKTLSDDEREAFRLMEEAVARMTAKGMSEMGAWRLAAKDAARDVREELASAMKGPNLSGLAEGLFHKADFAAAAAKYRDVAASVDMVGKSARRATRDVRILNHNMVAGFHGMMSGLNQFAGGMERAFRSAFMAARLLSYALRDLVGIVRMVHGVVRSAVRTVLSLAKSFERLVRSIVKFGIHTATGFMMGAVHGVERLASVVRGLVKEVERAVAGFVRLGERAAHAALHWGKWAAVAAVGVGVAASREGQKDADMLSDEAGKIREKAKDEGTFEGKGFDAQVQTARDAGEKDGKRHRVVLNSIGTDWDSDFRQAAEGLSERNDVPMKAVEESVHSLSERVREAVESPDSPTAQLFRSMGVSLLDQQGKMLAITDILKEIASYRNQHPNERADVWYAKVFGSADSKLIDPVLKGMSGAGLGDERARQERLGTFVSKDDIEQSKDFAHVMKDLKDAIKGVRLEIGRELMPYLKEWATELTDWLVAHRDQIAQTVTRVVIEVRRIGLALLDLGDRFLGLSKILNGDFSTWLDRVNVAQKVWTAGVKTYEAFMLLVAREAGIILTIMRAFGLLPQDTMFGMKMSTFDSFVLMLMRAEDALNLFVVHWGIATGDAVRNAGGWQHLWDQFKSGVRWVWEAGVAFKKFGSEVVVALGGWSAIGGAIKGAIGFVGTLAKALGGFMHAHGLDKGSTWVKFFTSLTQAIAAAWRYCAPYLKAFWEGLKIVWKGDEFAARDSPVLLRLIELKNRLVAWAKAALHDLHEVFLNGKDADGIKTWVGEAAIWLIWFAEQLPGWWEKIKTTFEDGVAYAKSLWEEFLKVLGGGPDARGHSQIFPWMDKLVRHFDTACNYAEKLFHAIEVLHGWLTWLSEKLHFDVEGSLMFLGLLKMVGIVDMLTGAWKFFGGAIRGVIGLFQGLYQLVTAGSFLNAMRLVWGWISGNGAAAAGAAGVAEGGVAAAGGAAVAGAEAGAGAAATAGAEAGVIETAMGTAGRWAGNAGRFAGDGLRGAGILGVAAGVAGATVGPDGYFTRQAIQGEEDAMNGELTRQQVIKRSYGQLADEVTKEVRKVKESMANEVDGGDGSPAWRASFDRHWKEEQEKNPRLKSITQAFNLQINGENALAVSENGEVSVAHAIEADNNYSLQRTSVY